MNDHFKYKPPDTLWIGCDLFIEYDCESKPQRVGLVITGIKQFGFIISHEYEVIPYVEESRRRSCSKEECKYAIRYEFDVRFSVYDTIGLGFGLGVGTGTFGWKSRPTDHVVTFTTRCTCCDRDELAVRGYQQKVEPGPLIQLRLRDEIGIAAVAAFTALGAGLAVSVSNVGHPLSQAFLAFTGASTLVSALIVFRRFAKYRVRKNKLRLSSEQRDEVRLP